MGVPVRPASAMLFALVLFCVAFAAAQVPRPCQSPAQWEGRIYRSDESKNFMQFAKISYDETNKYRLALKTRKCNVTTMTRPFYPAGIPEEGKYVGEAVVGPVNIASEHVTVVTYDGRFSDGSDFYGAVSYPDCVPISSGYYSNRTGFVHTSYYDIVAGLPDPSVFVPPTECLGPGR